MKAKTLQILWHNQEPVLSLDFHHPSGLLATAGADKEIRVWSIERKGHSPRAPDAESKSFQPTQHQQDLGKSGHETISAEYLFSLCHHNYAINTLRFSPEGNMLASGADGGEIALWKWMGSPTETETQKQEPSVPEHSGVPEGSQASTIPASLSRAQQKGMAALLQKLGSNGWKAVRTLSRHERDVLDLAWSPDGAYLVSGSVDNSAIIWDVPRASPEHFLQDHGHYVQGVSWDPIGAFVVTSSGDRSSRVYSVPYGAPPALKPPTPAAGGKGKSAKAQTLRCVHILHRREVSAGEGATAAEAAEAQGQAKEEFPAQDKACAAVAEQGGAAVPPVKQAKVHMFHDESMPSFFRRGSWSPDGSLLVLPAGMWRPPTAPGQVSEQPNEAAVPPANTCYVFSRSDLSRPLMHLPGLSKPLVVAKFCPVFYALEENQSGSTRESIRLPYTFVFAVASTNSVSIYSTQKSHPLALLGGLHYAPITDMAWSSDGLVLMISSQDGYCTVVTFQEGELGTPLSLSEIPQHIQEVIPPAIAANMRGQQFTLGSEDRPEQHVATTVMQQEAEKHEPMCIEEENPQGEQVALENSKLDDNAIQLKSGDPDPAVSTGEECLQVAGHLKACPKDLEGGELTSMPRSTMKEVDLLGVTSLVGNKRSRPDVQDVQEQVVA